MNARLLPLAALVLAAGCPEAPTTAETPPDASLPPCSTNCGDPSDPGPVGNVVAQASGVVVASQELALQVGPASLVVPADAVAPGTWISARLTTGVAPKAGAEPASGLVMQLVPSGLQLVRPAALTMPFPAPAQGFQYRSITAEESSQAWTMGPPVTGSAGAYQISVPHFSLWSAALVATSNPGGGPQFAGLTGASTDTVNGGVTLEFEGAIPNARQPNLYLNVMYRVYVSEQSGGQDFQNAFAVVGGPQHVGGLTPGKRYCFVVRATDLDGQEEQNAVERCAVAGEVPAPTLAIVETGGLNDVWGPAHPGVRVRASCDRGFVTLLLERSADASTWVAVDGTPLDFATSELDLHDVPPAAGSWHYRLRALDGTRELAVSAPRQVAFDPASGWRSCLWSTGLLQKFVLARTYVDDGGRLILGRGRTRDPISSADLGNPFMAEEGTGFPGPALFGLGADDLWGRVLTAMSTYRHYNPRGTVTDLARAADGSVFFVDGTFGALWRIGATGPAVKLNTAIAPGLIDLAVHPSDPSKLAMATPLGVLVSSDGGKTLTRWTPNGWAPGTDINQRVYRWAGGVEYGPTGTLFAGVGKSLARSDDNLSFAPLAWNPDDGPVTGIAVRSDGTLAVAGPAYAVLIGPPGALVKEDLPGWGEINQARWLSDGRLLAYGENLIGSMEPFKPNLYVRSTAGAWSASTVAHMGDVGEIAIDPRGGGQRVYCGKLRSPDGGRNWQRIPTGETLGATLVNGGSDFALLTFWASEDATTIKTLRSLDGGDTGTELATSLQRTTVLFDPTRPLLGLSSQPAWYTTDGGATFGFPATSFIAAQVGMGSARWYASNEASTAYYSEDQGKSWHLESTSTRWKAVGGDGATVVMHRFGGGLEVISGTQVQSTPLPASLAATPVAIAVGRGAGMDRGDVYVVGKTSDCSIFRSKTGAAGPYVRVAGASCTSRARMDAFNPNVLIYRGYYNLQGGVAYWYDGANP